MISAQNGEFHVKLNAIGDTSVGQQCDTSVGQKWDDGIRIQVKQIFIWHGDIVRSLQTTYLHNGAMLLSPRHGGVGDNFSVVTLDEPLLWVSGHYKGIITSLKFGTGRATYGPFGREEGKPFVLNSKNGISGFHGRSADRDEGCVYAIGVYIRTMATGLLDPAQVAGQQE